MVNVKLHHGRKVHLAYSSDCVTLCGQRIQSDIGSPLRAMNMSVQTTRPVTCKKCLKDLEDCQR